MPGTPNATLTTYLASLGPIGWWPLNDQPGSLTVADASGNGKSGTVFGNLRLGQPGPTPDVTSAMFDGATSYITTEFNPSGTPLSIVIWVSPSSISGSESVICCTAPGEVDSGFVFILPPGGGNITFSAGNGSALAVATAPGEPNEAAMLVGVIDGTNITLWQNGISGTPVALAGYNTIGSFGMNIGTYDSSDFYVFNGQIAQVAVYGYALSPAQIATIQRLCH